MSLYIAYVGEIIIKSEHRKGFGQLFRKEYDYDCGYEIEDEIISDFAREYEYEFPKFAYWEHEDCKTEWKGRYLTAYDEETGIFSYGVLYNKIGWRGNAMFDFFHKLLPAITERVISEDFWSE